MIFNLYDNLKLQQKKYNLKEYENYLDELYNSEKIDNYFINNLDDLNLIFKKLDNVLINEKNNNLFFYLLDDIKTHTTLFLNFFITNFQNIIYKFFTKKLKAKVYSQKLSFYYYVTKEISNKNYGYFLSLIQPYYFNLNYLIIIKNINFIIIKKYSRIEIYEYLFDKKIKSFDDVEVLLTNYFID